MDVTAVDPRDEALFAGWFAAYTAGLNAGRTDPPVPLPREVRVLYLTAHTSFVREAWAAVDGGDVVGAGRLEAPTADNLTFGSVDVAVPPVHRGRGIGAAVYERLAARLDDLGRTTLGAEIHRPHDGVDVPGAAFAAARGFSCRNVESRRVLDLAATAGRWPDLAADAAGRTTGYRLQSWTGPCPDEHAEQLARLEALVETEAPTGDLELEPERWDVARLRDEEAKSVEQGRSWFITVAVAPDGSLAGYTQLGVPDAAPATLFQWGTLVLRAHRGHRLGLALKVANLRHAAAAVPAARTVVTYNADSNGPMVAVNDALGFRVVERLESWQRTG